MQEPNEQTRPLSVISFFSSESFEESPELPDRVIRTDSAPMYSSSSSESIDRYSYDMVNAMEILNLAEALDVAEPSQEQNPVLFESEESDAEELLGSEDSERIASRPISVEGTEIPLPSRLIERVSLEDQQITMAQDTTSEIEYQSAIERGASRASVSSSVRRIPRVCSHRSCPLFCTDLMKISQSRISQTTNDSVLRLVQSPLPIGTRHTGSAPTIGSMREPMLRSGVKPRPPIPFTNTREVTNQHAHPPRHAPSRATVHSTRLSTTTPDNLHSQVLSTHSDRNIFSHNGSIACGFLRPTKSSEAKVSPKTPTKTDKQKTFMAFTASDRPVWR